MPRPRRTALGRPLLALFAVLVAIVAAASLVTQTGTVPSQRVMESIFQDDQLLLYQPLTPSGAAEVQRTLATLQSLGVTRLRLLVQWSDIAPAVRPHGFNASDPSWYAPAAWGPYDRIDRLARAAGLALDFDLSAPGPAWAMVPGAPDAKTATHYYPSASAFEAFAAAVGRRFDGRYRVSDTPGAPASPLPRVGFWSIWNEPNQPGWLAPQWATVRGRGPVPEAARIYRALVDAGFAGLASAGHTPRTDTIVFGELAPEGSEQRLPMAAMTPLPFVRALYCLDDSGRRLAGAAAAALGCPARGPAIAFVRAHPELFNASGFAHHPYSFFVAPGVSLRSDVNFAPLADLGRLERTLDGAFAAYGVERRIPIYLTEYGYETSPPRPAHVFPPGVSLQDQSRDLNEAQYLAWRDPRVRSMAQFLLQDSAPVAGYPPGSTKYWSSFQTGLEFLGGAPKFSLDAYRLPIVLPGGPAPAGGSVQVWGMLRPARTTAERTATVQWRPVAGTYRTLSTVTTADPSGFLTTRVTPPGPGVLRIAWRAPGGRVFYSRGIGITAGR